ncbi:ATP-dependent helicase HrpB [Entomobacter blattae]|uniref:RNA helicase n=1 Tax=Entomobacter blattae TaxID=2762277 RepID=A0A7H1NUS1_9PROT|nr:ATP-dependent helicase HrpB [Entomobacter blattae]QNT79531.1 hypothetical protein JGUZn3_23310 [Entomobacter blattae]
MSLHSPNIPIAEICTLPIAQVLPEIFEHMEKSSNGVVIAPPGAGKTTAIPLALLDATWFGRGQKLVMLEPRRLAARTAAYRMASLLGEKVGQTVGYTTRLEKVCSPQTRIEVITEGILIHRLMHDPTLEGIAAVLFDEVHERSLDTDFALACCLDVQQNFRPELRLLAMSATLDGAVFTKTMQTRLIESMGQSFPVDIRHTKHDIARIQDIPTFVAQNIFEVLSQEEGSILAFLPGAGEIHRCKTLIEEHPLYKSQVECLPLYGALPPEEQDKIFSPPLDGKRRIILATSIAETSLTVPGIRIVIDSGFRRTPQFSSDSGLNQLKTVKISRAAAHQRSGRAGRTIPGIAIRLWSEATQRGLAPQDQPEILNADLSSLYLNAAHWEKVVGTPLTQLPLLERPPTGPVEAAQAMLISLGALDDHHHHITSLGQKMSKLGTHPRLAAMLLAAQTPQEQTIAITIATLLEERDPIRPFRTPQGRPVQPPPADITLRLHLIAGLDDPEIPPTHIDRAALRRIHQTARQFAARMAIKANKMALSPSTELSFPPPIVAKLIAAAFPDRIAQKRTDDGSFKLSGGGSAHIPKTDPLAREKLLAVAVLHHYKTTTIQMAAPLDSKALPPTLLESCRTSTDLMVDPTNGAVLGHQRIRLGSLILQERTIPLAESDIIPILLEYTNQNFLTCLTWSESTRQLQARARLARQAGQEDLPDISDETLKNTLTSWLTPYLSSLRRVSDLKTLDLHAILLSFFSYPQKHWLDSHLPTHITLQGRTTAIDYTQPVPVVAAKAQFFFELAALPLLAEGKIPLQAALLSPAGRVQAITTDLASFWEKGWHDMRRDMKGRYPKHDWPEKPHPT